MILGAGVAVALRIVFTVASSPSCRRPTCKIVGGCLLLWIAVKLLTDDDEQDDVKSRPTGSGTRSGPSPSPMP